MIDDYLVIWVGFHLNGMTAQHTVGLVGKVVVTEHHHLLKFTETLTNFFPIIYNSVTHLDP